MPLQKNNKLIPLDTVISDMIEGNDISLEFLAGGGKSTMLFNIIKMFPDYKFLLVTYNNPLNITNLRRARELELSNVNCSTLHSLIVQKYGITVKNFGKISKELREWAKTPNSVSFLSNDATKEFKEMVSSKVMAHDIYLKYAYLKNMKLNEEYDFILIDEFQDFSYLMAKVILNQSSVYSNVIAGDKHQSIYNFEKSEYPLAYELLAKEYNYKVYKSNISYRCTKKVANIVNNYTIPLLNTNFLAYDSNPNEGRKVETSVLLFRTNMNLLVELSTLHLKGKLPDVYTVGSSINGYIRKVKYYRDNPSKLAKLSKGLKASFTLILENTKSKGFEEFVAKIKSKLGTNVLASTYHSFKGMEADKAYLFGFEDFEKKLAGFSSRAELELELTYNKDLIGDINLMYVGLTRGLLEVVIMDKSIVLNSNYLLQFKE